jgi:hypothetical protein
VKKTQLALIMLFLVTEPEETILRETGTRFLASRQDTIIQQVKIIHFLVLTADFIIQLEITILSWGTMQGLEIKRG